MLQDKNSDQQAAIPVEDAALPDRDGAALDTIGVLLRVLGKYAFDLDQLNAQAIRELCEQWARHVLVAAPCPGIDPDPAVVVNGYADRNWPGVRDFVTQLRRREHAFVTGSLKDMRQVLSDLINTLGKVLIEDEEEQTEIVDQLHHLKEVVESNAPLEAIKQEAMQVISAISRIAETRQHAHHTVLEELTDKLKSMRAELSAARREMELDPLTRLYNRKAFDQQLLRTLELSNLSSQPACLLMVDLDHFKQINDHYGHLAGDLVLKHFAHCCVQTFPRRGDFVARYGGEEFAIILQETFMDAARMLGERLLQAVRSLRIDHEGQELHVTVSIGIAELRVIDDAESWLKRADHALYQAKQSGRDRLVF